MSTHNTTHSILHNPLIRNEVEELNKKLRGHQYSPLFVQSIEEVITSFPNYANIIEKPIDLNIISKRLQEAKYSTFEDYKADVDLMLGNCKTFNSFKTSWAYKAADNLEGFFNRELKKSMIKIQKFQQMAVAGLQRKQESVPSNNNPDQVNSNIQVVSSSDDEKISKKIRNLLQKLGSNLNVTDEQLEEIISLIVKSIVKRNKSYEQIYEDTMKFLSKNLNNTNNIKSYFSRKFRKLLRSIKEEQTDGIKNEKAFNIKINLNESDEKRNEKEKLDQVRKEVLNFIDNQKIPEVFRNVTEYPIEPSLRKKITSHVNDIRMQFTTPF